MLRKNDRWLDQTGLNLIRIVIGSYFMAASLDLVTGVDQRALFMAVASPQLADLLGSTLLFAISAAFMTGVYLRLTSLMLVLFVMASSVVQTFLHFEMSNISGFWRDIALACAVMLNYSNLGRREMRRASVIARRRARNLRQVAGSGDSVMPRRIEPPVKSKRATTRARGGNFTPTAALLQHRTARKMAAAGLLDPDPSAPNGPVPAPSRSTETPAEAQVDMSEDAEFDQAFSRNIFANI